MLCSTFFLPILLLLGSRRVGAYLPFILCVSSKRHSFSCAFQRACRWVDWLCTWQWFWLLYWQYFGCIEWRYFRLHQIQVGGRSPSWIISNGHISITAHSIHLYSAHRAVIFATAQLSCLWKWKTCFYVFIILQINVFTARCTLVQSAVLRSHVVCLSVCDVGGFDHIGWNSSKLISPLVSLGCSLFATPTWRVCSKGNTLKFGLKVTHPLLIWASEIFDRKLRPNG